ncbi:MAG: hypothetical protein V3U87_17895 [Methylococcaceae bacterium]
MASDVKFLIKADSANAVSAFAKLTKAQQKAALSANKGMTQQNKFVTSIGRNVKGLIGGLGAIGTAMAVLNKANEVAARSARLIDASELARTRNMTLANGDPKIQAIQKRQERVFAERSGLPLEQSAEAVFNIRSLFNSEKERAKGVKLFADMSPFVADPKAFAEGIGTMRNAFGPKETGTIREQIAGSITAANASKTDPSRFGNSMSIIADLGNAIGAKDEFLMATLSAGSSAKVSTQQTADRLKALMTELVKNKVPGIGLEGKFNTLVSGGGNPLYVAKAKEKLDKQEIKTSNLREKYNNLSLVKQQSPSGKNAENKYLDAQAKSNNLTAELEAAKSIKYTKANFLGNPSEGALTGSVEAFEGFSVLVDKYKNSDKIGSLRDKVVRAQEIARNTPNKDIISKSIQLRDKDPETGSAFLGRTLDQKTNIQLKSSGIVEKSRENAAKAGLLAVSKKEETILGGDADMAIGEFVAYIMKKFRASPDTIAKTIEFGGRDVTDIFDSAPQEMLTTLNKIEGHLAAANGKKNAAPVNNGLTE